MRVASMDIGTNSVRLYIADQEGSTLHRICQELRITRLGEGVDAGGRLRPEAMERTTAALEHYLSIAQHHSVRNVQLVATSAVRDAANRQEFLDMVERRTQLPVRVLTGGDEARLSFVGALAALSPSERPAAALVLDIGGGSTEVFHGSGTQLQGGTSLQLGGVRMTERCVTAHPLPPADWERLQAAVRSALQPLQAEPWPAELPLIGVGGTATTAAALLLGLETYDPDLITGTALSHQAIEDMAERLAGMSQAQRLALPGLTAGREDIIVAGLVILYGVLDVMQKETITVSDGDLLQGVLLDEHAADFDRSE